MSVVWLFMRRDWRQGTTVRWWGAKLDGQGDVNNGLVAGISRSRENNDG